jgi:thiamine monophosphate synthase
MAGADGIAVVSAICAAPDPLLASREINAIIQSALKKRAA